MSDERRFDEREVALLLERAARLVVSDDAAADPGPTRPAPRGLTRAQVEEIAHAAGIPTTALARAIEAAARGELVPTTVRTALGIPVGVSRQVDIARPMSDVEWDRIVIRLRETFGAEGRVLREGSIRSWRNGNLRVVVEPTATGSRVRMSTLRTDAPIRTQIGVAAIGLSGVLATGLSLAPDVTVRNWGAAATIGALGVAMLIRNLLALPRWARTRAAQMERLSATIGDIVDGRA